MYDTGYWRNPDGQPINVEQADALLGDIDARAVGRTMVTSGDCSWRVSTVCLVLLHHEDMLFETMVFGPEHPAWNMDDAKRYRTRQEAERGHEDMIARIAAPLDAPVERDEIRADYDAPHA